MFWVDSFFSCKKYPDGGVSSNVKKKIIGEWDVEYWGVNGIDSTQNMKASSNYRDFPIDFVDINDHDDYSLLIFSNCIHSPDDGRWAVTKNKKQFFMVFESDSLGCDIYPLILNLYITVKWDIRKLTYEKLWIKTSLYNKEYFVKLTKKPK